jgi:tRNA 2-thiouridine synthesizing protein A
MTQDDLRTKGPDATLDVTGEICPYPELYTRKKLQGMRAGEVLKVITDHPPAGEETIPGYCQRMGYQFVVDKQGPVYTIFIKKGV